MIGSSLGASPPPPSMSLTLHSPQGFPSTPSTKEPSWGKRQLEQGDDHSFPRALQVRRPLIGEILSLSHQPFPFVQFWSFLLQFYCLLSVYKV